MGNGGVRMTMLGEKRAEYPSGIVRLSRLSESFGAGSRRRGLVLAWSTGGSVECRWCVGWVVGCTWGKEEEYVIVEGPKDEGVGSLDWDWCGSCSKGCEEAYVIVVGLEGGGGGRSTAEGAGLWDDDVGRCELGVSGKSFSLLRE